MKILKYLFLFLIFQISTLSNASTHYWSYEISGKFYSEKSLCDAWRAQNGYRVSTSQSWQDAYSPQSGGTCRAVSNTGHNVIASMRLGQGSHCPSATERNLKVPVTAGSHVCVENCQYKLTACVDIDFEPGMTCGGITTGGTCGNQSKPGLNPTTGQYPNNPDSGGNPPITSDGSNKNNDGSNESTNSSNSESNSTSTYNEETNTWNTTTVTKTSIDTSRLENTITNNTEKLIDKFKCLTTGDCPKDSADGDGDGGVGDDPFGDSVIPETQLTERSLQTNLFASSNSCPIDRTLNMNFMGRNFTHTFSFSQFCGYLSIIGTLILTFSYLGSAYIVVSKS